MDDCCCAASSDVVDCDDKAIFLCGQRSPSLSTNNLIRVLDVIALLMMFTPIIPYYYYLATYQCHCQNCGKLLWC